MGIYESRDAARITIEYHDWHKEFDLRREPGQALMKIDGLEYILVSLSYPPYIEVWGIKQLEDCSRRLCCYE